MAPDSPIGLFIKGRRLKPFFYAATIATPLLSHIIILAIDYQWKEVLYVAAMFWGLAYTCIQIAALPYILLNARQETHSEAISMSFLSFSVTICLVGVANFLLNQLNPEFFTEKRVLHTDRRQPVYAGRFLRHPHTQAGAGVCSYPATGGSAGV
ncbi:MAG: hypothetical protein KDD09_12985 [Phaeodactylibacter sp.]|nr:hypothetical protein [Phaeodactylibacter sp.]